MADSSDGNRARKRHTRRVLTAGAAASLVLTVGPALTTAAAAPQLVDDSPRTIRSSNSPTRSSAAAGRYRVSVRQARALLMAAQAVANNLFREHAEPIRRQFESRRDAATTKAELQEAAATYGTDLLPVKLERKAAMAQAKASYVANVERTRIQFLSDSGASIAVWAGARYEQSLHQATSEYRIAVSEARSTYRLALAPLRDDLRRALAEATSEVQADQAHSRFRLASADATGLLQLQIRQARDAYMTKVSIAKNSLRTAPV